MVKIIYLILILNFWAGLAGAETLKLRIGESLKKRIPANENVWIQNKKILKGDIQGNTLNLLAGQEGQTTLQIGANNYQVQVVHPQKNELFKIFQKELQKMVGLSVLVKNQQVTVSGKIFSFRDWLKLADISTNEKAPYVMAARISEGVKNKALSHWAELLQKNALPPVPFHFGNNIEVRLATSPLMFAKYQELLEPFGVTFVKDESSVEMAPVVRVQITVAEVRRDYSQKYGLKWPQSFSAAVLSNGQKEYEDAIFTANALEQTGQGRILASPNILCRSGKEAEFLAGGEFPIKLLNYKTQDVVWKKYGILLKVKPKADASGRMSIALETEISTIDNSRSVDGIPGLLSNRISSHFDLSKEQTIVLSGMIKNEEGQASDGLPLLSRIPILGPLFSSKDFRDNKTELVIFVRPSIVREDLLSDPKNEKPRHLVNL